jgi:hypothetical protein
MGTQIQIAQTSKDERAMNKILDSKYSLLCLPRFFPSTHPIPNPLGDCDSVLQIFFSSQFKTTVMSNIHPVSGEHRKYLVFPMNGLCIEWNRTVRKGRGYIHGRYYFQARQPMVSPSSAAYLNKAMSFIIRTIRKTYVKKDGEHYPIYVGPDLAKKIEQQQANLIHPNGVRMRMVDRKRSKMTKRIPKKIRKAPRTLQS